MFNEFTIIPEEALVEVDGQQQRHLLVPVWMADILADFLAEIEHRVHSNRMAMRLRGPKRVLRKYVRSDHTSGPIPMGLPKDAYHNNYLQCLLPHQLASFKFSAPIFVGNLNDIFKSNSRNNNFNQVNQTKDVEILMKTPQETIPESSEFEDGMFDL